MAAGGAECWGTPPQQGAPTPPQRQHSGSGKPKGTCAQVQGHVLQSPQVQKEDGHRPPSQQEGRGGGAAARAGEWPSEDTGSRTGRLPTAEEGREARGRSLRAAQRWRRQGLQAHSTWKYAV